jgi:hypothetical protein
MGRVIRVLAFVAGTVGMVWIGWPGNSTDSALPANRMYVVGTVVTLIVLPVLVRRYVGPVRRGWAPSAARAGGYAIVLALIAAKNAKDRFGNKLGGYFGIDPGLFALEVLLLLIIAAYVAGLLILTSERVRLTRAAMPVAVAFGAVTAGVLYGLAPFGANVDPNGPSLKWWVVAALVLPVTTGLLVGRVATRDTRPARPDPIQQGALAATCAMASAALFVSVLTAVTIALFPHNVPLQTPRPTNGLCETCYPVNRTVPHPLRHEYWIEISVSQAGGIAFGTLLLGPLLGAGIGAFGGGLGSRRRSIDGHIIYGLDTAALPSPPPPPEPLGDLRASDADREKVIDALKAAFGQGRLAKGELDARVGLAFTSMTYDDLAALTADIPPV